MKKYIVYQHRRLDTNEIFYIGIGNLKRAYQIKSRNKFWHNIINKTNYSVEILYENLTREEACNIEKSLISYYGRKCNNTGILCNFQKGGDNWDICNMNKEQKSTISKTHKNKKVSEISRKKMSLAKKDIYYLNNNPNSKKVVNIETKEIFNTLVEAASSINMNYSSFKWAIKYKKEFNFKYI